VQAVDVSDGELTMTIQPMSRDSQAQLLTRIRTPEPVAAEPRH